MKIKRVILNFKSMLYSLGAKVYFVLIYILSYTFLHLFSIGRPTYEFPHPLARVPQSAGYWVCF
jgi:hypothetical protein